MNRKDKTLKVSLTNTGILNVDAGKGLTTEEIRYIARRMLAMYPNPRKPINQKIDIPIDQAV